MGNLRETIQDYLWNGKELTKEICLALLPNTQKEKEAFLEEVKKRVNYYQPIIENKCKINLGEISVKDGRHMFPDLFCELAYNSAFENATNRGRIPTKKDFNSSFRQSAIDELIFYLPFCAIYSFNGADYSTNPSTNTIYVPFTFSTRFGTDFEERLAFADISIVHEISHILWKRILDQPIFKTKTNTERMWGEGFANYCAEEYFQGFYPKGAHKCISFFSPKMYQDGQKKVEKLVKKRGIESLLEVPKRWEEFEKEIE